MMKKAKCPNCDGVGHMGWYPDPKDHGALVADMCPKCYGTGQIKVHMTNADMVRQMDDEDLAGVLLNWFSDGYDEIYVSDFGDIYDRALEWLQQQAEDEDEV